MHSHEVLVGILCRSNIKYGDVVTGRQGSTPSLFHSQHDRATTSGNRHILPFMDILEVLQADHREVATRQYPWTSDWIIPLWLVDS